MKMCVCAVRDRATDCFARPMFVQALGQAVRSFSDEINRVEQDNMLHKHPEDFDLFELGTFDDSDASFELLEKPRQVAIGKDVVRHAALKEVRRAS